MCQFETAGCTSCINPVITHHTIIQTGIKPYLENIACVLTTALQASMMLKNYTVFSLIITVHLLDQWSKCSHSIYAHFIYGQLESMILSQLYKKTNENISDDD